MKAVLFRALLAASLGGPVFLCGTVAAAKGDDTAAAIEDLKKGQRELKAELADLNKQLKTILREVRALKAARRAPQRRRAVDTTVYDVKIGDSPVRGPAGAPVTIVEFADFQCPFCVREYPKLQQVLREYPKQVRLVFKNYPLSFHTKAPPAHAAAILAAEQGKFWQMHDLIIKNPRKLGIKDLRGYAEALGLDLARFDEVLNDPAKIKALYRDDVKEAVRCKVRGTPTILINGLKLANRSLAGYKARIEQILKGKKAAKAAK